MSADLYFTRVSFFLLLSSFFFFFAAWSPRSLNGTQRKSATWSEVSVIYKRMSEIWDTPAPTNRGPKNHLFARLGNLTATLTEYIFGMKHDIDNRSSALTTTRGLLHCPKMSWTLVHKQLQTRPAFYPPYVNSGYHFIATLRRRRSANGTRPHFVKRWTV